MNAINVSDESKCAQFAKTLFQTLLSTTVDPSAVVHNHEDTGTTHRGSPSRARKLGQRNASNNHGARAYSTTLNYTQLNNMDATAYSSTPRSSHSKSVSGNKSPSVASSSSPLSTANARLLQTLITLATQYTDDAALLQSACNSLTSSLTRLNHINALSTTSFSSLSWSSSAADNSRLYHRILDDCHNAHSVITNTIASLTRVCTTIIDTHSRLNTQLIQMAAPLTRTNVSLLSASASASLPTAALTIVELYLHCHDLVQAIMRAHSNCVPALHSLLSAIVDDAQPLTIMALNNKLAQCKTDNEQCRNSIISLQTAGKTIAE